MIAFGFFLLALINCIGLSKALPAQVQYFSLYNTSQIDGDPNALHALPKPAYVIFDQPSPFPPPSPSSSFPLPDEVAEILEWLFTELAMYGEAPFPARRTLPHEGITLDLIRRAPPDFTLVYGDVAGTLLTAKSEYLEMGLQGPQRFRVYSTVQGETGQEQVQILTGIILEEG